MSRPLVAVEWSAERVGPFRNDEWAIVTVDVIRATTTAVTAVAAGHACTPVATVADAFAVAARLRDPILAGELDGDMPTGFHMQNSPAAIAGLEQADRRPVVLLSTSGTRLMLAARGAAAAYVACLRNVRAQIDHLAGSGVNVAVVGAGSKGSFREEDRYCCALLAEGLVGEGHIASAETATFLDRWRDASPGDFMTSASVDYLRRTGQTADLDFVLSRVDDLDDVFVLDRDEIVPARPSPPSAIASSG